MKCVSRRSFLKGLGVVAGGGLAGLICPAVPVRAQAKKSRVVCVTDGRAWSGSGWTDADLDPTIVRALVARALMELTGESAPPRALLALFPTVGDPIQRYGIKVNCVNPDLPTHPQVVYALAELLVEAGASEDRIVVFDRSDGELSAGGFRLNNGPGRKAYGSDHSGVGFGEESLALSDGTVRLSRVITERIDHLISVPVLKNHQMAGVTLSLKNHFGSIDRPESLHGGRRDCSPGIAELNAEPPIRNATRLALIDGTFGTYRSGLGAKPDFAPMCLIASVDPVAADAVGQALINARREQDGLPPVDSAHIRDAAGMGLGTNEQESIERVDVSTAPVREKPKPWEKDPGSSCATGPARPGATEALGVIGLAAAFRALRRS